MEDAKPALKPKQDPDVFDRFAGQILALQTATTMLMGMESIRDPRFPEIAKAAFDGILGQLPAQPDPNILIAAREYFSVMADDARKAEQTFNAPPASLSGSPSMPLRFLRWIGGKPR